MFDIIWVWYCFAYQQEEIKQIADLPGRWVRDSEIQILVFLYVVAFLI